jgi:hypothetical protein
MTHTVDTLMVLADEYMRICTFMQDGDAAESAKKARAALRTALTEALAFNPDWLDVKNGRECGRLEVEKSATTQVMSWNLNYIDSTPTLNVMHSAFEDWFQQQPFATLEGIKQLCRDSYAAGMGDPLVTYADTQGLK